MVTRKMVTRKMVTRKMVTRKMVTTKMAWTKQLCSKTTKLKQTMTPTLKLRLSQWQLLPSTMSQLRLKLPTFRIPTPIRKRSRRKLIKFKMLTEVLLLRILVHNEQGPKTLNKNKLNKIIHN